MKKKILLIRHGKTIGNLEKRYIGCRTDEPLCEEGIAQANAMKEIIQECYKTIDFSVYSGPMKRVFKTAEILFENREIIVINNLTEIDFGIFENKNYKELDGNRFYQDWIDSNGESDYPEGEKKADFIDRSMMCFEEILLDMDKRDAYEAAVICHGGNIMAIMSSLTGKGYFDFLVDTVHGFILELDVEEKKIDLLSYSLI